MKPLPHWWQGPGGVLFLPAKDLSLGIAPWSAFNFGHSLFIWAGFPQWRQLPPFCGLIALAKAVAKTLAWCSVPPIPEQAQIYSATDAPCPFKGPSICLHLGFAFLNAKVCNNISEISSLPTARSTATLSLARKSVYGSLGPCIVLTKEGWAWPVGTTQRHAYKKTWRICCKSCSEYWACFLEAR